MRIFCVGQLVADILVTNVDYSHIDTDTVNVDGILVKNGGDCMNTAIDLAKLGADVDFGGMVGKDLFGQFLLDALQAHGIDTSGVRVSDRAPTSSVIALVNPDGQRAFLYYGGANRQYGFEDIDLARLNEAALVHVGGTYQLDRLDGHGAARLFQEAHRRGVLTSMDVTWDPSGRWLSAIEPCLPYLDLFLPSDNEARHITGKSEPAEMAAFLQEHGVGTVVIKLGKDGVFVQERGKEGYRIPAYDVKVVDTTGAGDSFVAGFLSRYIKGEPVYDCAVFASAVAAHCIGAVGATTGVPNETAILSFLAKQ